MEQVRISFVQQPLLKYNQNLTFFEKYLTEAVQKIRTKIDTQMTHPDELVIDFSVSGEN